MIDKKESTLAEFGELTEVTEFGELTELEV
jgi:hypothetical protein